MSGRPRKPTAELEFRGSFKKNPARKRERAGEPIVTGVLGPAPDYLSGGAKAVWAEMSEHGRWLTCADAFMVEIAASLMAQFRSGAATPRETTLLVTTLNKLGFGPAERSKIKAPQPKVIEIDPYEMFK